MSGEWLFYSGTGVSGWFHLILHLATAKSLLDIFPHREVSS